MLASLMGEKEGHCHIPPSASSKGGTAKPRPCRPLTVGILAEPIAPAGPLRVDVSARWCGLVTSTLPLAPFPPPGVPLRLRRSAARASSLLRRSSMSASPASVAIVCSSTSRSLSASSSSVVEAVESYILGRREGCDGSMFAGTKPIDSRDAVDVLDPVRVGCAGRAGCSACMFDGDDAPLRGEEAKMGEVDGRSGERGGRLRDTVGLVDGAGEAVCRPLASVDRESTGGDPATKGQGAGGIVAMPPRFA